MVIGRAISISIFVFAVVDYFISEINLLCNAELNGFELLTLYSNSNPIHYTNYRKRRVVNYTLILQFTTHFRYILF